MQQLLYQYRLSSFWYSTPISIHSLLLNILSALSIQTVKSFSTWAEDPIWISGLEDQSTSHQKIW